MLVYAERITQTVLEGSNNKVHNIYLAALLTTMSLLGNSEIVALQFNHKIYALISDNPRRKRILHNHFQFTITLLFQATSLLVFRAVNIN
jgi:hypothetical protein